MSEITRHIQSEKGARSGGTAYPFSRAVILLFAIMVVGCSLVGTSPEQDTALKAVNKQVQDIKKEVDNNSGTITDVNTRVTQNEHSITTIQSTTVHETPFWKISLSVLPFFIVYLIWRLIRAKVSAGSTVKNFLFGA